MKVCTDSCVLGAYAEVAGADRILDIGAGTGLLGLMAAQRAPKARIEAVEIDPQAAAQAQENFAASPWADRLTLHPQRLQDFAQTRPAPFQVILTNPPFFRSSLKSEDEAKNTAKHTGQLTFTDILSFAGQFLTEAGKLVVLLPPHETSLFHAETSTFGLNLTDQLWLEATPGGKVLRAVSTYARQPHEVTKNRLAVREQDGQYTQAFCNLLQDYYLIF